MYDIVYELSKFTFHSSKVAESVQEELEVMQSNHNIINLKITIFDLTLLAEENNNNIINKLILEFCFYSIYINNSNNDDDMMDNGVSELFDDYINENNDAFIFAICKDYRYKINKKIKEVLKFLDRYDINTFIADSVIDGYRGDCFTNTITLRLQRNFIDSDAPVTEIIVNPNT